MAMNDNILKALKDATGPGQKEENLKGPAESKFNMKNLPHAKDFNPQVELNEKAKASGQDILNGDNASRIVAESKSGDNDAGIHTVRRLIKVQVGKYPAYVKQQYEEGPDGRIDGTMQMSRVKPLKDTSVDRTLSDKTMTFGDTEVGVQPTLASAADVGKDWVAALSKDDTVVPPFDLEAWDLSKPENQIGRVYRENHKDDAKKEYRADEQAKALADKLVSEQNAKLNADIDAENAKKKAAIDANWTLLEPGRVLEIYESRPGNKNRGNWAHMFHAIRKAGLPLSMLGEESSNQQRDRFTKAYLELKDAAKAIELLKDPEKYKEFSGEHKTEAANPHDERFDNDAKTMDVYDPSQDEKVQKMLNANIKNAAAQRVLEGQRLKNIRTGNLSYADYQKQMAENSAGSKAGKKVVLIKKKDKKDDSVKKDN